MAAAFDVKRYEMARGGARQDPWPGLTGTCSPAQFFEVAVGVSVNLCCVVDAVRVAVGALRQGRHCRLHLPTRNLKTQIL
jgi:hypothetical protein